MEKLNILDVLLTYKNDSDKIAILGKAIETIIDYTEQIGQTFKGVNANIQQLAKAIMVLDENIKRIDGEVANLQQFLIANISKLEDTVTNSVSRLEDTVKTTTHSGVQTASTGVAAVPAVGPPAQRTSIVEENLMKPSQIGKTLASSPGPSPIGGGMSIRSAMMAEIKQRIGSTPGGGASAGTGGQKSGEIGGGYVPKIHQPREAKSLEGGLVSKMNKLLDTKFQKMSPSIDNPPSGPPSAMGAPRGPPSATPSPPPSAPSTALFGASSENSDKKQKDKKKKKKKKEKEKPVTKLSDLERKIREKLG
jgi:hypothetical protein